MRVSWITKALGLACAGLLATNPAADLIRSGDAVAAPARMANLKKPNIIVILADDLGYADISAYGVHRVNTPNIDSIGDEGIKFTDGYASAPVCAPSRAGLQTGRYQERFGFEYNDGPATRDVQQGLGLAVGEITLGQQLKAAGYHTGAIGKWHLGSNDPFYPTNRGYDEFVGFLPGETAYIDPRLPGVHYWTPAQEAALEGRAPSAKSTRAARRKAASGAEAGPRPVRGALSQVVEGRNHTVVHNENQYLTEYWADRAVGYIHRNSNRAQPYFLYLAPNAVHAPLMVTDKYYKRFAYIKNERNRIYAAMIAALDDAVGRVLREVDASGQGRNTLVYFMTDNGCAGYYEGMCSCDPLRGGKLSHYEGGVRVPFMMRWPTRIRPHQVDHRVVSLMDVFPTSVAAAGGSLPKDRIYDGVNLLPYIAGGNKSDPHGELMWRRRPLVSIRKGDWKLWESVGPVYGDYKLLFNLKTDLNETTNQATKYPAKVKELEADIAQWSKDLQDPKWPSRPPTTFSVCGTPFTLPI
jgi:arylsulfatase A-like enzyme